MEFPGEKLVGQLWDTIADKGIGSLLKPWQIRREGRARAEVRRDELLLLAQAEHDAEEIRVGRRLLLSDGSTVRRIGSGERQVASEGISRADSVASPSLVEFANETVVAETLRKEINVAKAVLHAESELAGDAAEPPSARVDEDWLYRWRDSAGAVSTEYLQQLWGKVLAGEIKSPNTFSLRTMEFLRNVSQDEAKGIELLAAFVIEDWVYRDKAILDAAGVGFGFFLRMQELGLIIGVDAIGIEKNLSSADATHYMQPLLAGEFVLIVEHDDPRKVLKLPVYKVTLMGGEILALGVPKPNMDYLRSVGKELCKQGFRVRLAHHTPVSDTEFRYFDAEQICPEPALGPSIPASPPA